MCKEQINTEKWIDKLKKSPIFNMSLSSKELFHSNFIAWILEEYPKYMGEFFSEYLSLEDKPQKITNVQREKKNIDISFDIGDKSIFIENKVKSIALSLKEPTFLDEKSCYISQNDVFWYYLSYETFVEKYLKKLIKKIPEEDKYNKFLICDYINFIEILNQNILGLINKAQIINIYKVGTCENDALKVLKELRMHERLIN